MNSVFSKFSNSGGATDTSVVFTQLKELFPQAKKIESVTVLKEFTELAYKDEEIDVKFEFNSPHTVKFIYRGEEYVNIDDEEFDIYAGNNTEEDAMLDYICYLEYFWNDYIAKDLTDKQMTQGLKEKINAIKAKVKKAW